jgi:hypothetical protein
MSALAPTSPASHDKAIEIATMLGDSVVDVKHCLDPKGGKVSTKTWTLLGVGLASLLASTAAFAVSVANAAANKRALDYWVQVLRKPAFSFRAHMLAGGLDWLAFGGLALGLAAVIVALLRVRDDRRSPYFRVGTAPGVELPLETAPTPSFPLVAPRGHDFVFNFGPGIEGELLEHGRAVSLAELAASGRAQPSPAIVGAFELPIPEHARIRARSGKAQLLVSAVERPRRHAVPLVAALESRVMTYFAGSLAVHLGVWALLQLIPDDATAANADLAMQEAISTRGKTTSNEDMPPHPEEGGDAGSSQAGGDTPAPGAMGAAGVTMAAEAAPRIHIKNHDAEPQLTREQVREQAIHEGILGTAGALQAGVMSLAATENFSSGFDMTDNPGAIFDGTGNGGGGFGLGRMGFGGGGGCSHPPCGIGVGNYHFLGAGSHLGNEYGMGGGHGPGLPGHHGAVPTSTIGQATSTGDYDKALIRRYIKRNIDKIGYCYERELLAHPSIAGTIEVQFFIQPNGSVRGAVGAGFDAGVANCVAGVVGAIEFPATNNGGGAQVTYPFNFRPAGH